MKRNFAMTLLSVVVILSFILSGCAQPTAAPKAAEPTKAPAAAQPTAAQAAAQPTAASKAAAEPTKAPAAAAPAAPAAGKYKEAPMLADQVKAGKLPPVDQRVSQEPLVVKAIEEIGQYGGVWRRAWKGPSDFHAYGRLNYDPVLRWPRDPKGAIGPGLASKWEFSADGKELTLFFRKGLKWSDGQPFTVDDVIFWWENIELDTELTKAPHTEWVVNGKPMTLQKIDDSTIKLVFGGPNGLVIRMLAFHGNQWPLNFERFGFFAPAHYLKQFHPKFNKDLKDYKLFNEKADDLNPERPAMTPWTVKVYKPGDARLVAERNPYYWKTDEQGQQLPYIDRIELTLVENNDAIAAKALACEIDMQFRNIALTKFPLLREKEKDCQTRTFRWDSAQGTNLALWPNQSYAADPVLQKIFQNKDFRIALSYAIDRAKINKISYLDQGVARTSLIVPASVFYVPEVEKLYAEFDVKKAAEYLDKAGLKLGADGVRLRPDGKPLEVTIETQNTGSDLDAVQLVAENWNAVGVKTAVKSMNRDQYWPRATGNEVQIATWSTDRGLEPFVDPIYIFPFDERSWMAPAYGIWYKTGGKEGTKPDAKMAEAMTLYDQFKATTDDKKQIEIGKQIIKLVTEEVWTISTVGMVPAPVVVKNNMRNVPEKFTQDWIIMAPGTLDPSHFFFKK